MIADRAWVIRNLGFDPAATHAPISTFANPQASLQRDGTSEDLQREIIDFDSEGPEGLAFFAFSKATGLSRFTDIPWPKNLAPKTDAKARRGKAGALPKADVLVVTWTVDEGHALSRVLTPGKDSRNDYVSYKHNFTRIAKKMRKGCPALQAGRLGAYWTAKMGGKTVVVFKSDSHMSQDTKVAPKASQTLPNEDVWRQIIEEVRPKLVITTGTAGGIGKQCEVGDVIVSPTVTFDCQKWLNKEPFAHTSYKNGRVKNKRFATAKKLFKANAAQLPPDNTRPPRIVNAASKAAGVLTTDFFGFDISDNHYGLRGLGGVCEMGDAILGLLMSRPTAPTTSWVAVRNVSDPQIKAEGSLRDQAHIAAQIYKTFGRWSSVCSAIVCWALITA
jgi:nucleoside phosphorylase